jgi:hypothetical protein
MTLRRFEVSVTTDASGDAIAYTPYLSGYIHDIQYEKTDYADGVDFAITGEATGRTIWAQSNVNAAAIVAPRQPTHTTAGVASLYAAAGTAVNDRIALSRDRIKIVVDEGGNAKVGNFVITVDDGRGI